MLLFLFLTSYLHCMKLALRKLIEFKTLFKEMRIHYRFTPFGFIVWALRSQHIERNPHYKQIYKIDATILLKDTVYIFSLSKRETSESPLFFYGRTGSFLMRLTPTLSVDLSVNLACNHYPSSSFCFKREIYNDCSHC